MRAPWRGFDWKMRLFCPRSQFLAGSSHAAGIFSKSARLGTDYLLSAFWTAGFTARPPDSDYRVGVVHPNISGTKFSIKSNNWVYF
jgi:hypothetical protein